VGGARVDRDEDRLFCLDAEQLDQAPGAPCGDPTGDHNEEYVRVKALGREVKELCRANEILRKAAAYFAHAELDRRGGGDGGAYQRSLRGIRSRANLCAATDCSLGILRTESARE
jgi:hypothetical protein